MYKTRLDGIKSLPSAAPQDVLEALTLELCLGIDSPRSLTVYLLLVSKEYYQLVNLETNPLNYLTADSFADDYFISKYLSKYPAFSHEELDPDKEGLKAFADGENACRLTNQKFRNLELDPSLWDAQMLAILSLAKRKISSLLRSPDLSRIAACFGWGPGSSSATKGPYTSAYAKFASRLDVTSNALVMGHCCINSIPSWVNCQLQTDEFPSIEVSLTREAFNIVRGNEIVFVPKNAKTHRVIAIEPHVNSFLQKGFGGELRRLMRVYWNLDLNDQGYNQALAKEGSFSDELATIDLKGASDSISKELVRYLLPHQWFYLLDCARSKQGRLGNSWLNYEKFSSMGNAFTFELETLIFFAICKSSVEFHGHDGPVMCYGDDIIVPSIAYDQVVDVIQFSGFTVNQSKSFARGPFRESCGKDYFLGQDVRPLFLKEEVSSLLITYKLLNGIRRYSRLRSKTGCDIRFLPAWSYVYSLIPNHFRHFRVPEGKGDGGILSNFDEATPHLLKPKVPSWCGYRFSHIVSLPSKQKMKDRHAGYTVSLFAAGSKEPLLGSHDLRMSTYPKGARSHTHGWCDLGPWV